MRYICKACKRKREQRELAAVGKAHNGQNIWLCRGFTYTFSNCNVSAGVSLLNSLGVSPTVSLNELNNFNLYATPFRQDLDVIPSRSQPVKDIDKSFDDFKNSLTPAMQDYFKSIGIEGF